MPDPSMKQPVQTGRQDGPGTVANNVVGSEKAKQNTSKRQISLGSKTNSAAAAAANATPRSDGQIYKYPLDGEANFPARMKFTIHQVEAYTVDTTEIKKYWDNYLLTDMFTNTTESLKTEEQKQRLEDLDAAVAEDDEFDSKDPQAIGRGRNTSIRSEDLDAAVAEKDRQAQKDTQTSNITDIKSFRVPNSPIIQLYLPQALAFNENVQYNQVDLGPGGLAAIGGLNAGSSLVSAVARGLSEGIESIFNLAAGQISGTAAQVAAARVSQAIPKVGLKAAAATALQTGINPGTRMIFDRPNIREFTFTFKFIPTSAAEASQVEQIIRIFREEMFPATLDIANGIPAGYKFPNLFQVELKFLGTDARFPKMQKSYLRNCQVVYNPNSMTFHPDGFATEVDMTLVFQEYRALSKQDIQKGY